MVMTNPEWEKRMRKTYFKPLERGLDGRRTALPSEIEKALEQGQDIEFDALIDLYPPSPEDLEKD